MINYQSAEDAISLIKNNERVFVHGGAATPNLLIDTLALNTGNLSGIEFVHIHTEGETNYSNPGFRNSFHTNSFFIGANLRPFVNSSNVQYVVHNDLTEFKSGSTHPFRVFDKTKEIKSVNDLKSLTSTLKEIL